MHDRHTPQPRRRGETGDIGGGPAAQADQSVLAANTDAAQHFPDETDDGQVLTGFGVRDFDAMRVNTFVRQSGPDVLGGLSQHRLMQDRDPVPTGEQPVEFVEQAGADHHRVRRVDGHLHGDRGVGVGHLPASALLCLRAAASAAGVAGVGGGPARDSVSVGISEDGARRQGGRRRPRGPQDCGSCSRDTM